MACTGGFDPAIRSGIDDDKRGYDVAEGWLFLDDLRNTFAAERQLLRRTGNAKCAQWQTARWRPPWLGGRVP